MNILDKKFGKPKGGFTGIVDLWDLPHNLVYIKLNKEFEIRLKNTLLRIGKTKKYVSLFIGIPFDKFRGLFRGQAKSLTFFEKLINFLYIKNRFEIGHEEVSKNVSWIGSRSEGKGIANPKLPFNFNSVEGATIVSAILHDGGISKEPTTNPSYRNYEKILRNNLMGSAESVVGDIHIKSNISRITFPKILGTILIHGIGMSSGSKTVSNQEIPAFILNGTEEVKGAFLRQAFDDDGSVYLRENDNGGREINLANTVDVSHLSPDLCYEIKNKNLSEYSSNVIKQNKLLLENLGIKVKGPIFKREYKTNKGEIRHTWRIHITYKNDFRIFQDKIGLLIPMKRERLNKIII
ncbi:LAGLIDADG family homing endonuclease [Candidatus Woesearchaeota archaeon]|nr:LAGLIDADG family homing endonuclease [Candidatus Woesearchaeota archaeon]